MRVLVVYDVATNDLEGNRRLRKVARACEDYGLRVQNSVFECTIGAKDWIVLRERLLCEIKLSEDSLRFYFLTADVQIEHHGSKEPPDLSGTLIV